MKGEFSRSSHLGDAQLAAYLDRSLSDEERDRIEDHLAGCDECRGLLLGTTATLRGERRRKRAATMSGTAAAALVISGLFFIVPPSSTPESPRLRGDAPDVRGASTALEAVSPGDGTAVATGSAVLVWRAVEGVARYRITVSDPESNVVFEGDIADTTLSLGSIGPLVPGEAYVWYVDALMADGTSLTTGVHSFSVRR